MQISVGLCRGLCALGCAQGYAQGYAQGLCAGLCAWVLRWVVRRDDALWFCAGGVVRMGACCRGCCAHPTESWSSRATRLKTASFPVAVLSSRRFSDGGHLAVFEALGCAPGRGYANVCWRVMPGVMRGLCAPGRAPSPFPGVFYKQKRESTDRDRTRICLDPVCWGLDLLILFRHNRSRRRLVIFNGHLASQGVVRRGCAQWLCGGGVRRVMRTTLAALPLI